MVKYAAGKLGELRHRGVIERVFSHLDGMLQLKNAIGYRIRVLEGCHPVDHSVFAREEDIGYTIVIEVDPHDYALIEPEVRSILKSFRFAGDG